MQRHMSSWFASRSTILYHWKTSSQRSDFLVYHFSLSCLYSDTVARRDFRVLSWSEGAPT